MAASIGGLLRRAATASQLHAGSGCHGSSSSRAIVACAGARSCPLLRPAADQECSTSYLGSFPAPSLPAGRRWGGSVAARARAKKAEAAGGEGSDKQPGEGAVEEPAAQPKRRSTRKAAAAAEEAAPEPPPPAASKKRASRKAAAAKQDEAPAAAPALLVAPDAGLTADVLSELGLDATADAATATSSRFGSFSAAAGGRASSAAGGALAVPATGAELARHQAASEEARAAREARRLPSTHLDAYVAEQLYGDKDTASWAQLPVRMLPRSYDEYRGLQNQVEYEQFFAREWNFEDVDDLAFYHMHAMREKAVNVYANVKRAAAMIEAYETDDYAMGEKQTVFSSWARTEINLAKEYDAFNAVVRDNIGNMVRQPIEEELREQLEAIGEAALLPPTESEVSEADKAPSEADVRQAVVAQYLDGILPGASLAGGASYADDIYGGPGGGEVPDELFKLYEQEYKDDDGDDDI